MQTQIQTISKAMQDKLDMIYRNSLDGGSLKKIYQLIISEENILLAYQKVRINSGAQTPGPDGETIRDADQMKSTELLIKIRNRLDNYQPGYVRFVDIPKQNGDGTRRLGIKSIFDRISEQAVRQVIEPQFEARFYNHSYGFRPYRSATHALSRVATLINRAKMYYVVNIDVDSFFDNVDHDILKRKLWAMGIRDKKVLSILSNMMKSRSAETGELITKGVAQGGVISPLLANVYLDELDHWVSSQWENFKITTKDIHSFHNNKAPKTNIKSGYIVRYADDFKIMCRSYEHAMRFYNAAVDMLKKRLGLQVNSEKSGIVNLKRSHLTFLGFDIRATQKGSTKNGWVAETHISKKALSRIKLNLTNGIKAIQRNNYTPNAVLRYNSMIRGIKNYYQYATHVYIDLDELGGSHYRVINARLKSWNHKTPYQAMDKVFRKNNPGLRRYTKISVIRDIPLDVINAVHHQNPMNYTQKMTPYTSEGRKEYVSKTHRAIPEDFVEYLYQKAWHSGDRVEYINNRIRKYMMQKGCSEISGVQLHPSEMRTHHKLPRVMGGKDVYTNLILITNEEHKLIHSIDDNLLKKHLVLTNPDKDTIKKLNVLRAKAGNKSLPKF